jgi:hypothetical protein
MAADLRSPLVVVVVVVVSSGPDGKGAAGGLVVLRRRSIGGPSVTSRPLVVFGARSPSCSLESVPI